MTRAEKAYQEAITPAIWKAYQEIVDQAWKERRRTMDKAERAYQEIVDQAWKAGPGREKEERCPRSYRQKRLNGNCGEAHMITLTSKQTGDPRRGWTPG